jgi:hypothetical protein
MLPNGITLRQSQRKSMALLGTHHFLHWSTKQVKIQPAIRSNPVSAGLFQ